MRLLILGANPETSDLVEVARKMGVYTIVTDFNPEAPAKKLADKSHDIDGMDVEKLVALARAEDVDGVLVGVADLLVAPYQKVCERLDLPCYASDNSVVAFSNKDRFKRICEEFGVLGVPEHKSFPVLVKPVDSCSGQGVSICSNEEELRLAIRNAESVSRSRQCLIEKYMVCDDVLLYYTFKNGECYLSATADRHTRRKGRKSPVNLKSVYPSKHTDLYLSRAHNKLKRMFGDLGVQNGVLLIQAFVEDGEFYVYDPGFRLQGEGTHLLLNAINGFDQREMLVRFALTGDMGVSDFSTKNDFMLRGKHAATLWFLSLAGQIHRIEGLDVNDHRVVHIAQRLHEGDVVTQSMLGTEKQVVARAYLVCDAADELEDLCNSLRERVRVSNLSGKSLLCDN